MTGSKAKLVLLDAACMKVRKLAFEHAARLSALAGVKSEEVVKHILRQMVAADLLRADDVLCRPLLEINEPLFTWAHGDEPPDFAALAYRLSKRWQAALQPMRTYSATRKAHRILGGVTRSQSNTQAQLSHDVHVASIYVRLAETAPELAEAWVAEDELADTYEDGEPRPDAVIYDGNRPLLCLEFGGAYDAAKLRHQHEGCAKRNLPYELW